MPREHIALVRECLLKPVLLLLCSHLMSSVSWQLHELLSASFIQRNVSHWSCQHSSSTVATTTLLTVCDERRWWLLMMLRSVVLETVHHIWSECTWLITGASSVSVSAAVCASTGYFPVPSFFHPLVTYLCLVSMISHYIILSECITVLISCRQSMFDRLIGIDCPRWSIADRFLVSSCCCFFWNQWYPHLLLIYCPPPQKYIQCSAVFIRGRSGNFICRFGVFSNCPPLCFCLLAAQFVKMSVWIYFPSLKVSSVFDHSTAAATAVIINWYVCLFTARGWQIGPLIDWLSAVVVQWCRWWLYWIEIVLRYCQQVLLLMLLVVVVIEHTVAIMVSMIWSVTWIGHWKMMANLRSERRAAALDYFLNRLDVHLQLFIYSSDSISCAKHHIDPIVH